MPETPPAAANAVLEEIKQSWSEMKQAVADMETRLPTGGLEELGEFKEKWDLANGRLDNLEAKMQRLADMPTASAADPALMPPEHPAHQEAYRKFLLTESHSAKEFNPAEWGEDIKPVIATPVYEVKGGRNHLRFEYKALSVGSDVAGGFLVSATMSQNVIQRVFDTSPMRQYATVLTIDGDAWEEPVDDDEAATGWVGETATRSTTDTPVFDKLRIPLMEVYAKPKATQKSIDLIGARIETWLSGKIADKVTRTENTSFVTGNGDNRPRGLSGYVNDSAAAWNQILSVVSGNASALTFDGFISVRSSLQAQYLPRSNWFMNRTTRGVARKLKDGEGQYLWQPNNQLGDPDTLDGRPVVIFEDVPDVGANAYPVYFGDMMQAYYVVDHTTALRILRDPYSAKPYVEFYATKYVGGGIQQGRALRAMKIST